MKNIAIIHTLNGRRYADLIASYLRKGNIEVDLRSWAECLPLSNIGNFQEWVLIHLRFGGLYSSLQVIKTFELMGYRLINNPFCIEHTTNKFLGTLVAKQKAGVTVPKTYLLDPRIQTELNEIEFPIVIKPIMSSEGKNIKKITNKNEYRRLIDNLSFEGPFLLQELIVFQKLLRIVVVGDKIIDAAYDVPKEGWKATVCLNPNVKPYKITDELVDYSFRLKEAFKGDIIVIDVFETKDGFVFNEINNACNLYSMYQATGVNHAKEIAKYLLYQLKKI